MNTDSLDVVLSGVHIFARGKRTSTPTYRSQWAIQSFPESGL